MPPEGLFCNVTKKCLKNRDSLPKYEKDGKNIKKLLKDCYTPDLIFQSTYAIIFTEGDTDEN